MRKKLKNECMTDEQVLRNHSICPVKISTNLKVVFTWMDFIQQYKDCEDFGSHLQ